MYGCYLVDFKVMICFELLYLMCYKGMIEFFSRYLVCFYVVKYVVFIIIGRMEIVFNVNGVICYVVGRS